jgi:hypothetical protein
MRIINFVLKCLKEYHLPIEAAFQTITPMMRESVSEQYDQLIASSQQRLDSSWPAAWEIEVGDVGPSTSTGTALDEFDEFDWAIEDYIWGCSGDNLYKCRKVIVTFYAILIASQTETQRRKARQMIALALTWFQPHDRYIWKGIFLSFFLGRLRRFIHQDALAPLVQTLLTLQYFPIYEPFYWYIHNSMASNNAPIVPGEEELRSLSTFFKKFIQELLFCSQILLTEAYSAKELSIHLWNWIHYLWGNSIFFLPWIQPNDLDRFFEIQGLIDSTKTILSRDGQPNYQM